MLEKDIENLIAEHPDDIIRLYVHWRELSQNYPNPFNPTTVIEYALPEEARVKLEIYSTHGQRVATLIDETKAAGFYLERFDTTGLASGLYFYRLQAGDFVDTKKLLLLK